MNGGYDNNHFKGPFNKESLNEHQFPWKSMITDLKNAGYIVGKARE